MRLQMRVPMTSTTNSRWQQTGQLWKPRQQRSIHSVIGFLRRSFQLKGREFIAEQQAKFLNHLKSELKHGEIIVLAISRRILHVLFEIYHRVSTGQMTKQRYDPKDSQLLHLNLLVISNSLMPWHHCGFLFLEKTTHFPSIENAREWRPGL